ncbi:MAG: hypothetical protein PHU91_05130 [Candidatus Omnitrophica bacterium]|nr:hypothetical protein [Candidatus Omnitrophota bacterium]MDD5237027.1 hypothetical protein [Candidatus Omnitrophota bacterium]MDD5610445.1 hypothetical protein [Candidatus Omnitrophota bacterium]
MMDWIYLSVMSWALLFIALGMGFLVGVKAVKEQGILRMVGIGIATLIMGSMLLLGLKQLLVTKMIISSYKCHGMMSKKGAFVAPCGRQQMPMPKK